LTVINRFDDGRKNLLNGNFLDNFGLSDLRKFHDNLGGDLLNGDGVIESRYFDNGFLDNWDFYGDGSHGLDNGDNLGFDRGYGVGSDGVSSNFRDLLAEDLNSEVSGVDNRVGTISGRSLDVELVSSALGSAVGGDLNLSVFSHPFDI